MGDWGINYDGFQNTSDKKKVKRLPLKDRYGREMSEKASKDKPMRRFRDNIDLEKLSLFMSSHEKYEAFVMALHDKDHAQLTFATICRKFGVTLHELQGIYTDGMRQLALLTAANEADTVMADVVEDAKNSLTLCPRCDGIRKLVELVRDDKGKVVSKNERVCPVCEGAGKIKQKGDDHSRDIVFEAVKITGQKGPMIAIQQNFGGGNGLDAKMEGMLKLTQAVVLGDKQTQTVEEVVGEHNTSQT